MTDRLEVLLLVPFQPLSGLMMDPPARQALSAHLAAPLFQGYLVLCEYLRVGLDFSRNRPDFAGKPLEFAAHRSLSAVTLATHLERAGLSWHAIDPGTQELRYWRKQL